MLCRLYTQWQNLATNSKNRNSGIRKATLNPASRLCAYWPIKAWFDGSVLTLFVNLMPSLQNEPLQMALSLPPEAPNVWDSPAPSSMVALSKISMENEIP
jgi:hypothetical protein